MTRTKTAWEGRSEASRSLFEHYMPRIMQCRMEDLVLQTPVQSLSTMP